MSVTAEAERPAAQGPVEAVPGPEAADCAPERPTLLGAALTILLGLAVLVLLIPFIQWVDYGAYTNPFELSAPPAGAVGLLVGLLLVNLVVFAAARARAFRRWQLVLLYVMLVTGLPVANVGLVQPVLTNITSVASEYVDRNVPSVAPAYAAQDPAFYPKVEFDPALKGEERQRQIAPLKRFWSGTPLGLAEQYRLRGASTWQKLQYAWDKVPWRIWREPLLNWAAFIFLLFLGILFLVEVLRQQWVERENLAFPLAVLPAALIDERTSTDARIRHPLLGNWLLWIGMGISMLMVALSGMRYYELGFDKSELLVNFQDKFTRSPWDALRQNILVVSPLVIGIGYLVHLEISRSIWIFFALGALFMLLAANIGWNVVEHPPEPLDWQAPGYPYPRDQAIGAMAALAAFLLWRSRGGLWALVKAPFVRTVDTGDGEGFMPRRFAGWGFIVCFVLLVAFMVRMFRLPEGFDRSALDATGEVGDISYGLIVLWLGLFFLMVVAFARLRAEAGIPNNFLVPSLVRVPRTWGGPAVFGWRSTNFLNHYAWMSLSSLPAMAPLQLEGLALARRHGPGPRTLAIGVLLAFVAALVVGGLCFVVNVHLQGTGYIGRNVNHGTQALWTFYRARGKNLEVGFIHKGQAVATVVGLVLMSGLLVARTKWLRFPLHPLGYLVYCVAPAHEAFAQRPQNVRWMHLLWAPMLIAWFIKRTVIRYGGMKLYRKLLPVFLGLILGQLLMLAFWSVAHVFAMDMLDLEKWMIDLTAERPVYWPEAY